MRKLGLFFLFIRLPLDYLAVVLAGITAYFLRFSTFVDWRPAQQLISFPRYMEIVVWLSFLWIAVFVLSRLYSARRQRIVDEAVRVFMSSSAAIMAVVILIFLQREFFTSRFIVLAAWVLSFTFVMVERFLVRMLELVLLAQGFGRVRAVVIGSGASADAIIQAMKDEPGLALQLVGHYAKFDAKAEAALRRMRLSHGLEEIIVADPSIVDADAERLLSFMDETQVQLRYSADLFATRKVSLAFTNIAGVPLLQIQHTPLEGWGKIYKRVFDIFVSFVLLVVTSPIMLVIAVCIKINSRGPVFFVRERVGEEGKRFKFYKFRSMKFGAPEDLKTRKKLSERAGTIPKIREDSHLITSVGRFIRHYSLDELPQFLNVFLGHMSLIGPRPHLPEEVNTYVSWQKRLLIIKPGLTGLAQISGRANLDFSDEARIDLWYIEHWSPRLDFAILLRTPLVVLTRKGAY